ncbi:hypothetical protein LSTR_LSTR017352 [Laodelphax striatellus]|uniref:Exonuclease domain-containing protein n=1 Tax=Laodelphax striatellus TaxID=195883 RepID=A0A482XNW6_LAOST|nr:hypothetical protein LSTR_LSTR017352 [Laodelphax striatellus]
MLPKPVCMLAHNGNRFDFPIIKSELAENGAALPDDLYCADTLMGFRALLYDTIRNADDLEMDSDEDTQFLSLLETENIIKQEESENDESLFEIINEVEELVESALCKETETLMNETKYGDDVWGEQHWDSVLQTATEKAEKDYLKEVKGIDLNAVRISQEVTPVRNSRSSTRNTKSKSTVSQVYSAATTLKEVKRSLFAGK